MSRKYSIVIQAHGDDVSDAPPRISAVMQLDRNGTPQLVELTVGAADGGPIPSVIARNIDFPLLAEALASAVVATSSGPGDADADAARPAAQDRVKAPATPAKERPYRKMPDVEEVRAVIERTHSVGKLARHFGVPRYTAQAWVDRLRRQGQLDDIGHPESKA